MNPPKPFEYYTSSEVASILGTDVPRVNRHAMKLKIQKLSQMYIYTIEDIDRVAHSIKEADRYLLLKQKPKT